MLLHWKMSPYYRTTMYALPQFPKAIEGLPKATEDSMRYVGVSYGSATKQRFPKPSEVGSKSGQSTGSEQKATQETVSSFFLL